MFFNHLANFRVQSCCPRKMDNDGHIQGGQLDDELDDEELDNILMYVVLLGFMFFFQDTHQQVPRRRRVRDSALSGRDYVLEIINGHEDRIIQNMRLDVPQFLLLCDLLLNRGYWHAYPSQRVGVHESVALTLMCLSHDERHRVLAERFQHSTETIDRHVRRVLRALVRLGRDLVRPRNVDDTHPRILNNGLLMPWFRVCISFLVGHALSCRFLRACETYSQTYFTYIGLCGSFRWDPRIRLVQSRGKREVQKSAWRLIPECTCCLQS